MLYSYSKSKCVGTLVLKNLITTDFKGIACMFQGRHMLKLVLEDLKETVDDALVLALPIAFVSCYLKLLFQMTICYLSS